MGAILSCLGISKRDPDAEDAETSRLLADDPFQSRYGTTSHSQRRTVQQPDPEAVRHEREAMGRIVDAMSDEVIDVFARAPRSGTQDRPPSFVASPRFNGSSEPARSAEEIAIKTLKKGKVRCIASVLDVDGLQQRTAKD